MDWLSWHFTSALGVPAPARGNQGGGPLTGPPGDGANARPTAVDLCVIQLIYEVLAAESSCATCDAPLGRALHVAPSEVASPQSWHVLVLTQCTGWRRHGYVATAKGASKDLLFGPFYPNFSRLR